MQTWCVNTLFRPPSLPRFDDALLIAAIGLVFVFLLGVLPVASYIWQGLISLGSSYLPLRLL